MFKRSNWLHLRIGFSVFLLPVFLFSLAFVESLEPERMVLVLVILHFFLYPSSNGYNSYYDKDEGSIGGLKNPPKVDKGLLYLRSEEHTSELQSRPHLVCRLLLEKKNRKSKLN